MKSNLSRRDFIRAAGMTMASLAAPSLTCAKPAGKRPNILFILADLQRMDSLGCCSAELAHTPVLEALARRAL